MPIRWELVWSHLQQTLFYQGEELGNRRFIARCRGSRSNLDLKLELRNFRLMIGSHLECYSYFQCSNRFTVLRSNDMKLTTTLTLSCLWLGKDIPSGQFYFSIPMFRFSIEDTCDKVITILCETKDPANVELIKKLKSVWGVGAEGETWIRGDGAVPGLLYMLGKPWNVQILCALPYRSKATEEGIWSGVYEGWDN